jgi:hypothetical protein
LAGYSASLAGHATKTLGPEERRNPISKVKLTMPRRQYLHFPCRICICRGRIEVLPATADGSRCRSLLTTPFARIVAVPPLARRPKMVPTVHRRNRRDESMRQNRR